MSIKKSYWWKVNFSKVLMVVATVIGIISLFMEWRSGLQNLGDSVREILTDGLKEGALPILFLYLFLNFKTLKNKIISELSIFLALLPLVYGLFTYINDISLPSYDPSLNNEAGVYYFGSISIDRHTNL